MGSAFWDGLVAGYQWQLSLYTALGIMAVTLVGKLLVRLVPTFREANRLNHETYRQKMENPRYAANQRWNRKWGLFFWVAIFAGVLPFCLTTAPQPVWQVLLDCFVILMVYDFFYYLVHRFLFHDAGFLGGPLIWVHAVHHRQHNPCREDSSYIHPLEVAMGLGLYVACIFVLSRFMGDFHVVTIVVTWVAFSQINLHNHDLWTVDRFPFRYLNTMSVMHHNHHARFTGGNFATISLLYDWMFGTLDYGEGYKGAEYKPKAKKVPGGASAV
ncbi:sterol desaturase family protein [Novosphingobium mangrovi (ex Huang et al. 2023)]|uniref:Sterol desaturase family protein n=1 Tax=Novosphingobium mangrovi (ex Huang et al. 2023) TaxID=2976432 RepID=A0ABT2I0M4_9SPHN|nr:sterol desaturase family protein [Novosphingobium mangrovi (ex Huang et al. 2023)]MCT2398356.1 sterol desaturase family protein [Novosphingobium mangrovi (ex Huang et al. 2023)]